MNFFPKKIYYKWSIGFGLINLISGSAFNEAFLSALSDYLLI